MKQYKKRILAFILAFALVAMNFTGLEVKAALGVPDEDIQYLVDIMDFTKEDLGGFVEVAEELEDVLNEADYTRESWDDFEKYLDHAEDVYEDRNATQDEIDYATIMLSFSVELLEPKVTVKLSATNYTYDGKVHKPTVTSVRDRQGNKISSKYYDVDYLPGCKEIGRYAVVLTFNGENGRHVGTKIAYFEIGPKNPTTVKTSLYGHDDVKVSWSKVSGASGYKIYYKKSTSSSYTLYKTITDPNVTSCKKSGLTDGAKYYFKVVAYKTIDGNRCDNAGKTSSIYTLKKVSTPSVSRYGTKVKVKWSNISGETGYQISRSTSKTGTYIVSTYQTTKGTYRYVSATKGKYYYYKVRAYRQVGDTKVYGPWSNTVRYRR